MTRFIIEWLNLAVRYAIPIVAESLFNLRLAVCCTPLESTVEPCAAHAVDWDVLYHADYFRACRERIFLHVYVATSP